MIDIKMDDKILLDKIDNLNIEIQELKCIVADLVKIVNNMEQYTIYKKRNMVELPKNLICDE
jgi:hypothetical protein